MVALEALKNFMEQERRKWEAISHGLYEITSPLNRLSKYFAYQKTLQQALKEAGIEIDKIKEGQQKWLLYEKQLIPVLRTLYNGNTGKFLNYLENKQDAVIYANFLSKKPYFKKFKKILKRAFDAHVEKDYTTSIPLLLICTDGIIIEYAKANGLVKGRYVYPLIKGKRKQRQANTNSITLLLEQTIKPFDSKFQIFVNKRTKKKIRKHMGLWEFRNDVMHGLKPNYADEQWSLKLMAILRMFYDCL